MRHVFISLLALALLPNKTDQFSFIAPLLPDDPGTSQAKEAPAHKKLRVIKFNTEVSDDSVSDFTKALNEAQDNTDVILVEINTPGGSVFAGEEMARSIEESHAQVICVVDGGALSMGYYILQSCPVRLMTKRSQLMIHEPLLIGASLTGGQSSVKNYYKAMHSLTEAMLEQYVFRTIFTKDEMRQRISDNKQFWVNYQDAYKYKMVDGIVKNTRVVIDAINGNKKLPLEHLPN